MNGCRHGAGGHRGTGRRFSHYFPNGVSALPHEKMVRAIEILGTRVAPIVRKELEPGQLPVLQQN